MARQEPRPTALNMFSTSLPKQFVAREGEAPAEPLHRWLGRSLALPKVFTGIGFAKMFRAVGFQPVKKHIRRLEAYATFAAFQLNLTFSTIS